MNQVFKVTVMIDGKPDPSQKEPFMFISQAEGDKACDLLEAFFASIGVDSDRINFNCEIQEVSTAQDFYDSMMKGIKQAYDDFEGMRKQQAQNWGSNQN